jgi:outer membrane lipoprotein-sorting protein
LPRQLRTNNTLSISHSIVSGWRALTAIAISLALGLSACAMRQVANPALLQTHDLTVSLADRDNAVHSMQTAAVMEYKGGGQHFKVRENIVLQRPASMRVEVMSPGGVALVVAADGGQIAVYDPGKDTLMRGGASAATLERYARIPMTPDAATRLLLALSPDTAMLASPPNSTAVYGDSQVLTYDQPDGVVYELRFNGAGSLEMVRETLAGGRAGYEVHYSDYRDAGGGIVFPGQVEASFPRTGALVKFRFENPSVNQYVPDSTFVLLPGSGTRKLTLGMGSVAAGAERG